MTRSFFRSEDGSLPLAMLAVMIVTALTVSVTATMVFGQGQTRRDESFEKALQAADTGLNRMATLIETREREDTFCLGPKPPSLAACTELAAGPNYTGTAVRRVVEDDWVITATGTVGGRSRTVQASIPMGSPFTHNPLGRQTITLNGGNSADSYRSGSFSNTNPRTFTARAYTSYLDANNNITDKTGRGFFATEGPLNLNGQSFVNSDGAQIYYAKNPGYDGINYVVDPLPGATGICLGVTSTCDGFVTPRDPTLPLGDGNRRLEYYRDRVNLRPLRVPYQPTEHFDGCVAPSNGDCPAGQGKTLAPGIHVFRSARLYSETVIQGTPTNPTVIYLTGQLTTPSHAKINYVYVPNSDPTTGGILRPKPSTGLIIYSVVGGTAVQFPTGVSFSGGIYAPNGEFLGGSQGEIWGGLVALQIRTTGGWKFHYDETMAEIRGSDLKATDWVELGG